MGGQVQFSKKWLGYPSSLHPTNVEERIRQGQGRIKSGCHSQLASMKGTLHAWGVFHDLAS